MGGRWAIVGTSGSGKSTLARAIAERHHIVHIELDALYHQADWQPTPTQEFRQKVAHALDVDGWVVCGNFAQVSDLVHRQADVIVWLDLPRWLVISQLLRRSLWRGITRQRLWNGNRESLRNLVSRTPEKNVLLWAWQHHAAYRARYTQFADGPFWAHATVHRLRSRSDVKRFLRADLPASVPRT